MSVRRQYRRRKREEDEEEEEDKDQENTLEDSKTVSQKLEEARELQSIRKRPTGMSAAGLAFGKKLTEEEKLVADPFKLKTGGLVELRDINPVDVKGTAEEEVVKRLTSQFSAETQTRDDETNMMKYIDDEMAKRKGTREDEKKLSEYEAKIASLYKLPEKYQVDESKRSEDMLSNQMLSGIPEVDLGLDAKFRNIEETEMAKQKLLDEQKNKKEKKTSMIPRNVASNFTLHSLRFFKEKDRTRHTKKTQEEEEQSASQQPIYIPVVGANDEPELKPTTQPLDDVSLKKRKSELAQMPTDNYHFDRFKKKARSFR